MQPRLILACTLLLNAACVTWSAPLISAPWGQISGNDVTSLGGAPYSAYLGVPYALPPVGQRRFAKPQPHPGPGDGVVFSAVFAREGCPQPGSEVKFMNEDCLTLDVYAPQNSNNGLKSVMIWIHGGGFLTGAADSYIPSDLVTQNDVIVVVIQYRLGILGFLSSGDDVSFGNYGLHDQNLAITWVKNNIRAFGGDPDSITLFGQSSGAASVGYQLISPYSKGLFSRAILQSGAPIGSWASEKRGREAFRFLASKVGCSYSMSWMDSMYYVAAGGREREEHGRMLDCLRQLDANTLVMNSILPIGDGGLADMNPWVPTVDGDFLPRDPLQLLSDVDYLYNNDVTSRDVMLGVNNNEGAYLVQQSQTSLDPGAYQQQSLDTETRDDNLNEDREITSPTEAFFRMDEGVVKRALKADVLLSLGSNQMVQERRLDTLLNTLEFFYTKAYNDGKDTLQVVSDIVSDTYFVLPSVVFSRALAEAKAKVASRFGPQAVGRQYMYLFNHYPITKEGQVYTRGTVHGEDLGYMFDPSVVFPAFVFTSDEPGIANTFRSMLTDFAKTSQPQVSVQAGGVWPEFSVVEEKFLSLEVNPRVDDHLYSKRMALWTQLLPSLVNSTRPQDSYNSPGCMTGTKNFVFKGRLNFFKLP